MIVIPVAKDSIYIANHSLEEETEQFSESSE